MQPGPQPARCSFESCFNMKYENNEYRSRHSQALKAAQNLVTLASYQVVDEWALPPPALREGLNVPAECLILLPSGGDYPYRLVKAVRETRMNVLIVEPGKTIEGAPTIYFTLLRCAGGRSTGTLCCGLRLLRIGPVGVAALFAPLGWRGIFRWRRRGPSGRSDAGRDAYFSCSKRGAPRAGQTHSAGGAPSTALVSPRRAVRA
jgi:hypothetical protein